MKTMKQLMTEAGFKWFVDERRAILARKTVGRPRPWTDDPWLSKHHFTNVDRRDDAGTIRLLKLIGGMSKADSVLNACAWRLLCRSDTAEAVLPISATRYDEAATLKRLRARAAIGPVFGPAYFTYPWPGGVHAGDVLQNHARFFGRAAKHWTREVNHQAKALFKEQTLTGAVARIRDSGMGQMMSLQVALDLSEDTRALFWRTDDIKLPSNSGARTALRAIYGRQSLAHDQEKLAALATLTGTTHAQAEHTLCEFGKYLRLRDPKLRDLGTWSAALRKGVDSEAVGRIGRLYRPSVKEAA